MIALIGNTMARTREYDEEAILTAAMHAFRKHGYGGNSIKDLEVATGLTSGSIYNSFGDKSGLFAAALTHYNLSVLTGRIATHAPKERGLEGLKTLFLTLLAEPDGGSYGCLITNTAIEFGGGDALPQPTYDGLRILAEMFSERLSDAKAAGQLPPGIEPEIAAQKLLALYQGVLVLVRAVYDHKVLTRMIEAEFQTLGGS
jgi:TetR/AcrR family transcriptional regulator, transcriptional repressor for nem operon